MTKDALPPVTLGLRWGPEKSEESTATSVTPALRAASAALSASSPIPALPLTDAGFGPPAPRSASPPPTR